MGRHEKGDPPPVLGPNLPSHRWLLGQDVWWYPHRRPAALIAAMDKPWRYNTVRWLERRAPRLEFHDAMRGIWADAPDGVVNALASRTPMEYLREQPLYRRLNRGLPHPESAKGRALALRAIHWHTCAMRKAHPARLDTCTCIRDGSGRIVGGAA
jgi:hypothetical protein